jgi:hypothetical protein
MDGHKQYNQISHQSQRLMAFVLQVLHSVLQDTVTTGVFTEEQIAEIVARYSLSLPIPNKFLPEIQVFVTKFCELVAQQEVKAEKPLQQEDIIVRPQILYIVFHNGSEQYYYEQLPEEVLKLRKKVLFWIYQAEKEFYSRDRKCKRLRPQTQRLLRCICDKKNSGQTITFAEIYALVWRREPPSNHKMIESIEVEMSALNVFAAPEPFERIIDSKAKILRVDKGYLIKEDAHKECCIIRVVTASELIKLQPQNSTSPPTETNFFH